MYYTMQECQDISVLQQIDTKYDDGAPDTGFIKANSEDESDPVTCVNSNAYIVSITSYAGGLECGWSIDIH